MEPGRDSLLDRRIWQQVASDLLNRELIVRHVVVERIDHPIAVQPCDSAPVRLEAVGVGVPRQVEPELRLPLAIVLCFEQSFDRVLIRVRAVVGEERVDLFNAGREADEVEADATDQSLFGRLGRRLELLFI